MSWRSAIPEKVKRPLRGWLLPEADVGANSWFASSDIDRLSRIYYESGNLAQGPWDRYRHANLILPDWFRTDLDPLGPDYATQQHRLWQLMSGKTSQYNPDVDERESGWDDVDPIRSPGYFARRDAGAIASAGDHTIANGMLLKHCGLEAGDSALEFGAGFAQGALSLARLGVDVDTVDISPVFCDFIRRQADHYGVPLTAFQGRFGLAPRPQKRYRLVWFYESFHHCVDFLQVVPRLADLLTEDGKVILAGEPIVERSGPSLPYPWGVRLHGEVAAVVRRMGWFELGFTESFLFDLFARSGLVGRRIDCDVSDFGTLYVFTRARQR